MLGSIFNAWTIGSLLISLAIAYHVIRNGKSPFWLVAMALISFTYPFATPLLWLAYLFIAVVPDMLRLSLVVVAVWKITFCQFVLAEPSLSLNVVSPEEVT